MNKFVQNLMIMISNKTLHAFKMKKGCKLDFESQFFNAVNNFIEMNCTTEKKNITHFNLTSKTKP